ncbi:hypothetical protein ACHAW6_012785, partial [Cyclotella cf. meneghiniana]
MHGEAVDILCDLAPEVYSSFITTDKKGNKQLLMKCLNASYGSMVASLLYYKKFTWSLKSKKFVMNEYDPCLWNKVVDGTQLTFCFHVDDDCKLSHASPQVLDKTIKWLRKDYDSIFEDGCGEMKVARGKKHKYLGMELDFSTKVHVKILMCDYVKDIYAAWNKQ